MRAIEIMGEHIAEEDNHVPSSFSSLTESQENPPVQTSQLGLRRLVDILNRTIIEQSIFIGFFCHRFESHDAKAL